MNAFSHGRKTNIARWFPLSGDLYGRIRCHCVPFTHEFVVSEVVVVQDLGRVTGVTTNPVDQRLCVMGFTGLAIPTQSETQDAEPTVNTSPIRASDELL